MVYRSRLPVLKEAVQYGVIGSLEECEGTFSDKMMHYKNLLERENPLLLDLLEKTSRKMAKNEDARNRYMNLALFVLYTMENQVEADEMAGSLPPMSFES